MSLLTWVVTLFVVNAEAGTVVTQGITSFTKIKSKIRIESMVNTGTMNFN